MHLELESIDLKSLKIKKDKRDKGIRGRCVYYDKNFYYKIWGDNYYLINEFVMAVNSGFIDSYISPGFVSVIKDKNMTARGYVYKKCKRNYEDVSFYKNYFSVLKKKNKRNKNILF